MSQPRPWVIKLLTSNPLVCRPLADCLGEWKKAKDRLTPLTLMSLVVLETEWSPIKKCSFLLAQVCLPPWLCSTKLCPLTDWCRARWKQQSMCCWSSRRNWERRSKNHKLVEQWWLDQKLGWTNGDHSNIDIECWLVTHHRAAQWRFCRKCRDRRSKKPVGWLRSLWRSSCFGWNQRRWGFFTGRRLK